MRIAFLLSLIFLFACQDEASTPEELLQKMESIEAQIENITSTKCSATSSCRAEAIGVKACGGPARYLIFGSTTDEVELSRLIAEFNELNRTYNEQTGAISDCALQLPPELTCSSGECVPASQ